jgi:FemAB-related protein (PEP-CTERM system-associated)
LSTTGAAATSALAVRAARAGEDARRDAYVRAHPRGTFFHLSGWRRVVERVYGHDPLDLHAWRGEQLAGVLPLMLCRGPLGRGRLISVPYGTYGGPLGDDAAVEHLLVEHAQRLAEELAVGYLELRCIEDPGLPLVPSTLYSTFLRDLPDDPAEVLAHMPKKARAEARKARDKHRLELSAGHWYLDDLQRMFLLNKRALGSPGLPPAYFHALLEEFERSVFVHLVRQGGTPLAAVMSFAHEGTLIAYYAGTQPGADRAVSASNFMYLALQEWAVERGFARFDFCRSRVDSGAFEFKRHQGFEPTPLHYRYHLVKHRRPPSFTPSNPRTALLRTVWSRLPLFLARSLSERLARYLP